MAVAASTHASVVKLYDVTPELVDYLPAFFGSKPDREAIEPLVVPAVRENVTWYEYRAFLSATGQRSLRHSYANGVLELMSPRVFERENAKAVLRRFVQSLTLAKQQPVVSLGTATLASPSQRLGIEPDETFRFARPIVGDGGLFIDMDRATPPDFAVEVGCLRETDTNARVSAVTVDRLRLLARLGVREVWCVNRGSVRILHNMGQRLVAGDRSQFFAGVTSPMLSRHLRNRFRIGENACISEFVAEALSA